MRAMQSAQAPVAKPLPYAENALEPYISAETIKNHYQLYQNYAKNYAAARQAVLEAKDSAQLRGALDTQAFQGAGFQLHDVYFQNMTPNATTPGPRTTAAMNAAFGSLQTAMSLFSTAGAGIEGPGWVVIGWQPDFGRLTLVTPTKHEDDILWQVIPILVMDVWEHAYYLDYKINRPEFIAAWMRVINWDDVEARIIAAESMAN